MQVYIRVVDHSQLNHDVEWPEGFRLPVENEYIATSGGGFIVQSVNWFLAGSEGPDSPFSIQIDVNPV